MRTNPLKIRSLALLAISNSVHLFNIAPHLIFDGFPMLSLVSFDSPTPMFFQKSCTICVTIRGRQFDRTVASPIEGIHVRPFGNEKLNEV